MNHTSRGKENLRQYYYITNCKGCKNAGTVGAKYRRDCSHDNRDCHYDATTISYSASGKQIVFLMRLLFLAISSSRL